MRTLLYRTSTTDENSRAAGDAPTAPGCRDCRSSGVPQSRGDQPTIAKKGLAGWGNQSERAIGRSDAHWLVQPPTRAGLRAAGGMLIHHGMRAAWPVQNVLLRRIQHQFSIPPPATHSSHVTIGRHAGSSAVLQSKISLARRFASPRNVEYISDTTKSREQPSPARARTSSRALVFRGSQSAQH